MMPNESELVDTRGFPPLPAGNYPEPTPEELAAEHDRQAAVGDVPEAPEVDR